MRSARFLVGLLSLLWWAAASAQAQTPVLTLRQLQLGQAEEPVTEASFAPGVYAYKLSIDHLPMTAKLPASATDPQIEAVVMAGPTFDADEAARRLLSVQRRYAHSTTAVRKAVEADPQARLLLLPHGRPSLSNKRKQERNAQEQELAQGYCQALAAQLRQQYPRQAAGHPASAPESDAAGHSRPQLTLLPGQYPRFVAPGTVLHFPFPRLNWLKYAPTVTSQGRLYEYAQTILPSLTPSPGAVTNKMALDGHTPTPQELNLKLAQYTALAKQLESAYMADYLDERPATRAAYFEKAKGLFPDLFPGENNAGEEMPPVLPSVAAWQFANFPQILKTEIDKQLNDAQQRIATVERAVADASKEVGKAKNEADKRAAAQKAKTAGEENNNAKQAQKTLAGSLKPLQDALAPYLAADQAKRLEALGQLLALALDSNPPHPTATSVLLPDEKDLAEITVEYKLRPGYQSPPVLTTLPKEEFPVLLLPRFRITASVGIYTTGLVDHRFAFVRDSAQVGTKTVNGVTTPVYGARQRIARDNSEEKYSLIGAAAFGHFEGHLHPNFGVGLTLGVGVQNDGPRILLGPSLLFGNAQRLIVSGGWVGGRVTRLATGYSEGQLVQNPASSQVPTRTLSTGSWFFSLSYNLSSVLK